jgi:Protein of unknown function (DUF4238)
MGFVKALSPSSGRVHAIVNGKKNISMPRHHFVPKFLLNKWAVNGQLRTYKWIEAAGQVVSGSASVAAVCQVEDLHSFFGLPRGERESPERKYFTPRIDTPAAGAHSRLLAAGVASLSAEQRRSWARFVVAFGVRTPETLRRWGPAQYRRAMAQAEANSTVSGEVEAVVSGLINNEMAKLERNVPLNIAMELCEDLNKVFTVENMNWWLRRFDGSKVLFGDRPLLSQPTANWPCGIAIYDPNYLIALPIEPRTVFFASANPRYHAHMRKEAPSKLLRNLNLLTVESAIDYVFAYDGSTEDFVRRCMHGRRSVWPRDGGAPSINA